MLALLVSNAPTLTVERADLENQAGRFADAIGQHGYSPVLSAQLSKVESRMAEIDQLLYSLPGTVPQFDTAAWSPSGSWLFSTDCQGLAPCLHRL